jgi:hypothetical protein
MITDQLKNQLVERVGVGPRVALLLSGLADQIEALQASPDALAALVRELRSHQADAITAAILVDSGGDSGSHPANPTRGARVRLGQRNRPNVAVYTPDQALAAAEVGAVGETSPSLIGGSTHLAAGARHRTFGPAPFMAGHPGVGAGVAQGVGGLGSLATPSNYVSPEDAAIGDGLKPAAPGSLRREAQARQFDGLTADDSSEISGAPADVDIRHSEMRPASTANAMAMGRPVAVRDADVVTSADSGPSSAGSSPLPGSSPVDPIDAHATDGERLSYDRVVAEERKTHKSEKPSKK